MNILAVVRMFILVAWDSESIDHWKIEKWNSEDYPLVAESSFATLFPKYREKYLQQIWPHVDRKFKEYVSLTYL